MRIRTRRIHIIEWLIAESVRWQFAATVGIICLRPGHLQSSLQRASLQLSSHPAMLLSRFREQLRSSEWADRERVPLTAGLAILQVIARRIDSQVSADPSDLDMARAVILTLPAHGAITEALGALLYVSEEEDPKPAGP